MDSRSRRRMVERTFKVVRGHYRVTLDISWAHDDYRGARAEMLHVAAVIEERSRDEQWVVEPEQNVGSLGMGRIGSSVAIELMHATPDEAERAERTLRAIGIETFGVGAERFDK